MQVYIRSLILVGMLMLQGCDFFDTEVKVEVDCNQIEGGFSCTVERLKGSGLEQACWSTAFVCENGIKIQHDMCSNLPPDIGAIATKIVAWQEISSYKDCDNISADSVENLVLK